MGSPQVPSRLLGSGGSIVIPDISAVYTLPAYLSNVDSRNPTFNYTLKTCTLCARRWWRSRMRTRIWFCTPTSILLAAIMQACQCHTQHGRCISKVSDFQVDLITRIIQELQHSSLDLHLRRAVSTLQGKSSFWILNQWLLARYQGDELQTWKLSHPHSGATALVIRLGVSPCGSSCRCCIHFLELSKVFYIPGNVKKKVKIMLNVSCCLARLCCNDKDCSAANRNKDWWEM